MHVTAIMRILRIEAPSWILFEETLKGCNCGDGLKKMIAIRFISMEDYGKDWTKRSPRS